MLKKVPVETNALNGTVSAHLFVFKHSPVCPHNSQEDKRRLGAMETSFVFFLLAFFQQENKPWVTKSLNTLLNKRNRAFYMSNIAEKQDLDRAVR